MFLNYGKSFINTLNDELNSPRFLIESKITLLDMKTSGKKEYYLIAGMQAEHTFNKDKFFKEENYHFSAIFCEDGVLTLRSRFDNYAYSSDNYVVPYQSMWGGMKLCLNEVSGRKISDFDDIYGSIKGGLSIMGRTEIINKERKIKIVMEYPIKTINCNSVEKCWQVDTGPVCFCSLKKKKSIFGFFNYGFYEAYIAFCNDPINKKKINGQSLL